MKSPLFLPSTSDFKSQWVGFLFQPSRLRPFTKSLKISRSILDQDGQKCPQPNQTIDKAKIIQEGNYFLQSFKPSPSYPDHRKFHDRLLRLINHLGI